MAVEALVDERDVEAVHAERVEGAHVLGDRGRAPDETAGEALVRVEFRERVAARRQVLVAAYASNWDSRST